MEQLRKKAVTVERYLALEIVPAWSLWSAEAAREGVASSQSGMEASWATSRAWHGRAGQPWPVDSVAVND